MTRKKTFVLGTVTVLLTALWTMTVTQVFYGTVTGGRTESPEIQLFLSSTAPTPNCSTNSTKEKPAGLKIQDFIQNRLLNAEENWIRSNARRSEVIDQVNLQPNGLDLSQAQIFSDFFYPSFDCPFTKERIGRVGDGGKWICGFDQLITKADCVVFSFGVNLDTSFEAEILRRTQSCAVHMFDPTISTVPALVSQYPGRAFFHFRGIGFENGWNLGTLKFFMEKLGVQEIDVLKMDVEGAEWGGVSQILTDFPDRLPFAQLQLEVHLNNFGTRNWLTILRDWFDKMEEAGLRQFFQEANLLNPDTFSYRELAFLNTKMSPFEF